MLSDIEAFIRFFHGQRRRTRWVMDTLPEDKGLWRPWPGEMSAAEILCHVGAAHLMYATVVAHDRWEIDTYEAAAVSWEASKRYLEHRTEAALDMIRDLPNGTLKQKRSRPGSGEIPIPVWRLLMLMVEHEIHHRSQLESYLMLLNIRCPSMGGVSIAAVREMLAGATKEPEIHWDEEV